MKFAYLPTHTFQLGQDATFSVERSKVPVVSLNLKFQLLWIYDIPSISGRASGHEPHQHFPSHFYQFETSKKHQTTRCRPSSQRALTLGIWFLIMQLSSGRKVVARHVFLHDTNTYEYTVPCSGSTWAVPKGVAQSIAIGWCIYCIQHGGGSNCPATETWDVANLFLQSRGLRSLTPVRSWHQKKYWWLYHQGSVSLGVGNFKLHLSQRIRVWFSG